MAVPFKYETGVEPGDTLYFHHLVVLNGGAPLLVTIITTLSGTMKTTLSIIKLLALKVAVLALSTLLRVGAFLNRSKKRKFKSRRLSKLSNKQKPTTKGRVAFTSPGTEALGLKLVT